MNENIHEKFSLRTLKISMIIKYAVQSILPHVAMKTAKKEMENFDVEVLFGVNYYSFCNRICSAFSISFK
jgi:hypothetical protein